MQLQRQSSTGTALTRWVVLREQGQDPDTDSDSDLEDDVPLGRWIVQHETS